MKVTLSSVADLNVRVEEIRASHHGYFPGDSGDRQPVHTVYVPADRFTPSVPGDFGAEALRLLDAHAPDLTAAFGIDSAVADAVRARVVVKLASEPVEDLRIDFEDGYGVRSDEEEDAHVDAVVESIATAYETRQVPHFWGLRVKSFSAGGHARAMRTLDGFLTGLRDRLGRLPGGFVVTFPKVVMPEQVGLFAEFCGRLEDEMGLPDGTLRFEVQFETTEAIVNHRGELGPRAILEAAGGRLAGAHFGVFDYTAACGLPPAEQRLDHPACDFARHVMQVGFAGTGVRMSDGSTNIVPASDATADVHAAWQVYADHVRHSLRSGFYQGWDLHPSHLAGRFAVVYAFHLAGLDDALARVRAWEEGVGDGAVRDEPATIHALVARLRRAADCGAIDPARVPRIS